LRASRPRRLAGVVVALVAAGSAAWPAAGRTDGRTQTVDEPASDAIISIIIDDIGDGHRRGNRAIELPGPVTYAFLPMSPHAVDLADLARSRGKEVLLHLPMESLDGRSLGPVGLRRGMSEGALREAVEKSLASVPHVVGVNNHMGSYMTTQRGPMRYLMEAMARRQPLFFVDSRTTSESVASEVAGEVGVPNTHRDVFLDNDSDPESVRRQFFALVNKARRTGAALGIGHPYPTTMAVLQELLPTLGRLGVRLVPVTTLLPRKNRRFSTWRPQAPHPRPVSVSPAHGPREPAVSRAPRVLARIAGYDPRGQAASSR
jgi:uncharacterized protein